MDNINRQLQSVIGGIGNLSTLGDPVSGNLDDLAAAYKNIGRWGSLNGYLGNKSVQLNFKQKGAPAHVGKGDRQV